MKENRITATGDDAINGKFLENMSFYGQFYNINLVKPRRCQTMTDIRKIQAALNNKGEAMYYQLNLPSYWIRRNKLKRGDLVEVSFHNNDTILQVCPVNIEPIPPR